ncbi:1-(5-phosphoribosyl)-5-amino-4-imidazole- carboxylate (AIR) carboxylase [Acidimicrobium ferrooxidans DSM 10331]|uniref:1-(5-phosphoribosyl)-5-amino-4-imidazole-carboxylate (AIR) carboxylase n=2 Tax=Acidimicrobium ferrooxidans TaxID=53635 RepID=C7M1M0_ACIFD|nr:1-(5-phosphoribosyl)-5-amino-4-imidazole- carboxylate (AIR) carboxylase [Acidimicrobium ferrooxidans DSM 10331]
MQPMSEDGLVRSDAGWFDTARRRRIGLPEAIYAPGKAETDLVALIEQSLASGEPTIVTRVERELAERLVDRFDLRPYPALERRAPMVALAGNPVPSSSLERVGLVGILAAGTSDRPVAAEAACVIETLGHRTRFVLDCGVAALARSVRAMEEVADADVVVVVAGFEGALASVVGGSMAQPLIAVPTSTGYGAARGGETALWAMLATCAQGVCVVGVDNGFGAGCAAVRIVGAAGRNA